MELLERTLRICFTHSNNFFLINTDTFSQPIAKQIMGLRLSQSPINSDPIVMYGFRSLEQVLRSEKEHAWLILGPRIYHLQLPVRINVVHLLSNRIERESVDKDRFLTEFKESSFADAGLSRMESAIAHGRGNFLGCEKLLYGAYLARAVDSKGFRNGVEEIRTAQQRAFALDSMDYQRYRLLQVDYEPKGDLAQTPFEPFHGKILYIDDHAHLGWSTAIATALWGNFTREAPKDCGDESLDILCAKGSEGQLWAVRKKAVKGNEASYFDSVLDLIRNSSNIATLKFFDVILLDLRLRYTEDEMTADRDIANLSGIQVLAEARKMLPGIPIVILTASRKAKNLQRVLQLGADYYFIKEIPIPEEKTEDVFRYWQEFRETLDRAASKSFLSPAWDLIKALQKMEPKNYLKNGVRYDFVPQEQQLAWDRDVVLPIIKGLGFVRLDPHPFEKELYGLDPLSEAIMNFNLPNDAIDSANKKSKKPLYLYVDPNFEAWILLFGLRSLGVHKTGESLNFEDAKIALYLSFRLFFKPDVLHELASQMFGKASISSDQMGREFFEAINGPLIRELGIDKENSTKIFSNCTIQRKANLVTVSFQDSEEKSELPYLPLMLIKPRNRPVFDLFKSRKEFHYRMFLGRLHYLKDRIEGADWNLVSAIYRQVFP